MVFNPLFIASMIKRKESEHQEQCELMRIVGLQLKTYPELCMLFAIPNGGNRNIVTAMKLKREGVRAGVPDLMLAAAKCGYHGLFIEMKIKPNKPTEEQTRWMAYLLHGGYRVELCYSAAEAWDAIKAYLDRP